jgi:ferredoxin
LDISVRHARHPRTLEGVNDDAVQTFRVRLLDRSAGLDATIEVPDDGYVLDAALEAEIELPFGCQAGVCTACMARLLVGRVNQDDQSFLDDEELESGWVLTCVAFPEADCTLLVNQELQYWEEKGA